MEEGFIFFLRKGEGKRDVWRRGGGGVVKKGKGKKGGGGDGGIGACCLGQGGDGHALSRCFRRQTMVWYIYFRIYMIFVTF